MSHDTCDCCSTSIGWIWNPEAETAEPCPVCAGEGEIHESDIHTAECAGCAGSGAFAAWAAT